MEQWLLNPGTLGDLHGVTGDATVRSRCSLIYQTWKFIHPFINLWDLLQIAYLCWSPQHEKVLERLLYRQSASCAASRLSLQSAVMEWWMLWHTDRLFFPTSAPCWHAPWLMLIIPWTLLFLMSSKVFLLVGKLPVIACLIPASFITEADQQQRLLEQKLMWQCIWHHLLQLQKTLVREFFFKYISHQYNLLCLNYRKQDWLGISSTLNCSSREVFHHTIAESPWQVLFKWQSGPQLMIKWSAGEAFLSFFF